MVALIIQMFIIITAAIIIIISDEEIRFSHSDPITIMIAICHTGRDTLSQMSKMFTNNINMMLSYQADDLQRLNCNVISSRLVFPTNHFQNVSNVSNVT